MVGSRSCIVCETEFEPRDARQKSCSVKCAHKAKPKKYKRDNLRKYYGITVEDWNRMFDAQEGCCAICGTHQSELNKTLFVDHNHTTGTVRGLLCQACNFGIGLFKDSPDMLKKATEYLSGR